jgi:hypothetical protein
MKKVFLACAYLCALATLATLSTAQQTSPARCKPPIQCDPAKLNPFCVDARNGAPALSAGYGHKDIVQVYLMNKSPFLYDYSIKTQSKDFSKEDGDALSTFSSLTGVGSSPKTAGQPSGGQPSGGQQTASDYEQFLHSEHIMIVDESTAHQNASSACKQTLEKLNATMNAVDGELKSSEDAITALAHRMQDSILRVSTADLRNAGSSGDELCGRAVALRTDLDGFVNGQITSGAMAGAPLADDFDASAEALTTLTAAANDYKSDVTKTLNCDPDNCEGRFQTAFKAITQCSSDTEFKHALEDRRNHDTHLKDIEQNISQLTKKLKSLNDARCQLDATRTQLDRVLDDDTSFYQRIGPFGPYSDSEDVTLSISRSPKKQLPTSCGTGQTGDPTGTKPTDSKTGGQARQPNPTQKNSTQNSDAGSSVADVTLHFGGGQRFFAAAGPVVSLLPVKEFQRATGVNSSGAAATIIDYKTNSRTRVTPIMLFAHWRPFDADWFLLSVGATAKSDNQKTSAEFMFGPTFGFIGNRVFFTTGGYLGQQQKLAGNLQVGQTVPTSLQGEINFRLAGGGGSNSSPSKSPAKKTTTQKQNTGK